MLSDGWTSRGTSQVSTELWTHTSDSNASQRSHSGFTGPRSRGHRHDDMTSSLDVPSLLCGETERLAKTFILFGGFFVLKFQYKLLKEDKNQE